MVKAPDRSLQPEATGSPKSGMTVVRYAAATTAQTKRATNKTTTIVIWTILQNKWVGRMLRRVAAEIKARRPDPLDVPGLLVHVAASLPIFPESVALCRAAISWGGLLLFIRFDAGGAWCVVSLST
ncbi:hypothetical protein PDE01_19900 [Paracoccus denitrificans]|nr:hypothetical protein PDE01_19900 [Paracoccus denitrificans]